MLDLYAKTTENRPILQNSLQKYTIQYSKMHKMGSWRLTTLRKGRYGLPKGAEIHRKADVTKISNTEQ